MNRIHTGKKTFIEFYFILRFSDFEVHNDIDNCNKACEKTKLQKQNLLCNEFHKISELSDLFQSGYCESPIGHKSADWFANEIIKLENKLSFYF